jgi:lipid-binding SYLF domain-containing protein
MHFRLRTLLGLFLLALPFAQALADDYAETIKIFREAKESGTLLAKSYGYAVFPTVGKGGIGIGGAYGKGRVYANGAHVGDTSMSQVSIGAQLGGEAYREIVLLENKAAFDNFTSGNFEFSAEAGAMAITAGAQAQTATTGNTAGATSGGGTTKNAGHFYKGMAVFTAAKGGLMFEATIAGQKFSYEKKK